MDTPSSVPTAAELISFGFSALIRGPFRTIWLLLISIAGASASLSADAEDASLAIATTILFAVFSFLLEMTAVLAASAPERSASTDLWIRDAVKRRIFWRFAGASVLSDLSVAAGALVLLIGGFVMGAFVGLAPQAAVLERRLPMDALARSVTIGRPARKQIGLVYGLLMLVPTLASAGLYFAGARSVLAQLIAGVLTATLGLAGSIALTRAFVELGGGRTPAELVTAAPGADAP